MPVTNAAVLFCPATCSVSVAACVKAISSSRYIKSRSKVLRVSSSLSHPLKPVASFNQAKSPV
jgi:hypothetical protein